MSILQDSNQTDDNFDIVDDLDDLDIDDIDISDFDTSDDLDDIEISDLDDVDLDDFDTSDIDDLEDIDLDSNIDDEAISNTIELQLRSDISYLTTMKYIISGYWSSLAMPQTVSVKTVKKKSNDEKLLEYYDNLCNNLSNNGINYVSPTYGALSYKVYAFENSLIATLNKNPNDVNIPGILESLNRFKTEILSLNNVTKDDDYFLPALTKSNDKVFRAIGTQHSYYKDIVAIRNHLSDKSMTKIKSSNNQSIDTLLNKLNDDISVISSIGDEPISNTFSTIKKLEFLDNNIQKIKCSCGNCIQGEDLLMKFYIPQGKYSIDKTISEIIPEVDNPEFIATENKLSITIIDDSTGEGVCNGIDVSIPHFSIPDFKSSIDSSMNLSTCQETTLCEYYQYYASCIDFNFVKCEQCGKYMLLSKDDMRFFTALHFSNSSVFAQSKCIYNSSMGKDNKYLEKSPTLYRYKNTYLQESYNNYINKYLTNLEESSNDNDNIMNYDLYSKVLSSRITETSEIGDPVDHLVDKLTEDAWNFIKDNYNNIDYIETQLKFENTDGYAGKDCSDGYYPYINFMKIILSDTIDPDILDVKYLAKYFLRPELNPMIYYGLIVRKYYNALAFSIEHILSFIKLNGDGKYQYYNNQVNNSFHDNEGCYLDNIKAVYNLYNEFNGLISEYFNKCNVNCYQYYDISEEMQRASYNDLNEIHSSLIKIKDNLELTYTIILNNYTDCFYIFDGVHISAQDTWYVENMIFDVPSIRKDKQSDFSEAVDYAEQEFDITTCLTNEFNWRMCCVMVIALIIAISDNKMFNGIFNKISTKGLSNSNSFTKKLYKILSNKNAPNSGIFNGMFNDVSKKFALDYMVQAELEDLYGAKASPTLIYNVYDYNTLTQYTCMSLPSEFRVMYNYCGSTIPYRMIMTVLQSDSFDEAVQNISSEYLHYYEHNRSSDDPDLSPSDTEKFSDAVNDLCLYLNVIVNSLNQSNSMWKNDKSVVNEINKSLPEWIINNFESNR